MTDEQIRQLRESIRNQTDEEFEVIWNRMVENGIIDQDGYVLKRIPEPPDWLAGRNGQAPKAEPPAKPARKPKRPSKRA